VRWRRRAIASWCVDRFIPWDRRSKRVGYTEDLPDSRKRCVAGTSEGKAHWRGNSRGRSRVAGARNVSRPTCRRRRQPRCDCGRRADPHLHHRSARLSHGTAARSAGACSSRERQRGERRAERRSAVARCVAWRAASARCGCSCCGVAVFIGAARTGRKAGVVACHANTSSRAEIRLDRTGGLVHAARFCGSHGEAGACQGICGAGCRAR
jgi:hypothetical protein